MYNDRRKKNRREVLGGEIIKKLKKLTKNREIKYYRKKYDKFVI